MASTNPRVREGDNSGEISEADKAATIRHIVLELNKCRRDKRSLNDDEKDVKSRLKEKGLSSKSQSIGRRLAKIKGKKETAESVLEGAEKFLTDETFKDERAELDSIADEKREISKRERELRHAAIEKGIEVRTLPIVRSMEEMDSIERAEFYQGIVEQCKALRFW